MATITQRTDDITGEVLPDNTPTTRIFIQDPRGEVAVEVDLSDTSFKGLQKSLSKILDKSRAITTAHQSKGATDATEAREARLWALANAHLLPEGVKANERGKVSGPVIDAYRAFLAEGHASEATLDAAMEAGMRAVEKSENE